MKAGETPASVMRHQPRWWVVGRRWSVVTLAGVFTSQSIIPQFNKAW